MIDINTLTLGEVAKVEDLSGLPIGSFAEDEKPKGRALAALAFVWHRRSNPKFTFNEALALSFTEAKEILGIEDEDDVEGDEVPKAPASA